MILFCKARYNITLSGFYYCYCAYFCYKLVTLLGFSYLFFLMPLINKIPHQNYSKSPSFFYPNNKTAFQKIIFSFTYTVTFTAQNKSKDPDTNGIGALLFSGESIIRNQDTINTFFELVGMLLNLLAKRLLLLQYFFQQ